MLWSLFCEAPTYQNGSKLEVVFYLHVKELSSSLLLSLNCLLIIHHFYLPGWVLSRGRSTWKTCIPEHQSKARTLYGNLRPDSVLWRINLGVKLFDPSLTQHVSCRAQSRQQMPLLITTNCCCLDTMWRLNNQPCLQTSKYLHTLLVLFWITAR